MRKDEKWSFQTEKNELVTSDDVCIEICAGDIFTRYINVMIPPGFDCHT
jgi:hypothetical protein